jgi:hypothetical protein
LSRIYDEKKPEVMFIFLRVCPKTGVLLKEKRGNYL